MIDKVIVLQYAKLTLMVGTLSVFLPPCPTMADEKNEPLAGPVFPDVLPQKKRVMTVQQVTEGLKLEEAKARRRFGMALLTTAANHISAGLLVQGEPHDAEFRAAEQLLDALLMESDLEGRVTRDGGMDLANLRLSEVTWGSALRYRLRGEEEDFLRAKRLLLEFASEMPGWPVQLSNKRKRGVPQDSSRLAASHDSGGLWWRWYPLDLMEGAPLLYAYALLEPRLTAEERGEIEKGVFETQLSVLRHWEKGAHNTLVYLIDGYVSYGLVLKRPELIHRAVQLARELIAAGYSPDGLWHEGTPAYHRQVEMRLRGCFQRLEGYSDPAGWRDPQSGARFDGLSLKREFAAHMAGTDLALEKLTLPDGFLAAVNDADPKAYEGKPRERAKSELLGTSGYAVLGAGMGKTQSQLFLNYKGTFGHEHLDVNGLHWYALGRRWFDETRYRPLRGSGSERAWSSSTAAHNTVVIDERSQPNRFREPWVESFGAVMAPYATWPLKRIHAGSNHMGDLLLFDGRQEGVQVMEVEGKKAYPGVASRYRRTLVKVDLGEGEGYLVDIFRVKGGTRHDYMLHGALAEPYDFATSASLDKGSGLLHGYLQVLQGGKVKAPFEVNFAYGDGAVSRSVMLSPALGELLVGEAPAINRLGKAMWVDFRHDGGASTFVVVHEARRAKSGRVEARLLSAPGEDEVAVEVRHGERVDMVLSTLSAEGRLELPGEDHIRMLGRLGWMRKGAGGVDEAWLWDGQELAVRGERLCGGDRGAWTGEVVATHDGVIVRGEGPEEALQKGATLHVDLGGLVVWSYPIREVVPGDEPVLLLEYAPGFLVNDGGGEMTRHPGWKFEGKAKVRVPMARGFKAGESLQSDK